LTDHDGTAADRKRLFKFNLDWITRPLFGLLLAGIAIGSLKLGWPFAVFIAIGAIAGSREWHRMVGNNNFVVHWIIGGMAIGLSLITVVVAELHHQAVSPYSPWPWVILVLGAAANFAAGFANGDRPVWQAFGVVYLGVAALLAILLRLVAPDGFWVVLGILLAIWSTDTGALIFGNLIGGPKLAPVLSPNKTWAGTFGGVFTAAVVEAIFVGVLGGNPWLAAVYGAAIGVIAHAGDLFESRVKRMFQRKDSGGLIPGHGGMLDRIDSTLSSVPAVALAVFVFQLNPLFGAHP
jgi:phosphatidate cytidylyltransferase